MAPPEGVLNLNCDGSSLEERKGGFGGVIRG